MKAIVTIGISASGKSTWAAEYIKRNPGTVEINRDSFRGMIMVESGLEPVWRNWKWKREGEVTRRVEEKLKACAENGLDIIISDTNLQKDRRVQLMNRLRDMGYDVSTKVFEITYDEAVRRDNERHNGVGAAVIQKQWQQYLDEFGDRVKPQPGLPNAVIVDIDGTVALMDGVRGPFEWDKVGLDKPNTPVIQMVEGLAKAGNIILFTSGRDGCCMETTLRWLDQNTNLIWATDYRLFMRAAGDTRKDTVIKKEIFYDSIHRTFNVVAVIDDRPSVCRMWRDLGLNVIQVGNPYIEF